MTPRWVTTAIFLLLREKKEMPNFVNDSGLEVCERFSARGRQTGEFFDPSIRIGWIELLYLGPGKSFPVAEVNLAQAWSS